MPLQSLNKTGKTGETKKHKHKQNSLWCLPTDTWLNGKPNTTTHQIVSFHNYHCITAVLLWMVKILHQLVGGILQYSQGSLHLNCCSISVCLSSRKEKRKTCPVVIDAHFQPTGEKHILKQTADSVHQSVTQVPAFSAPRELSRCPASQERASHLESSLA